MGTIGLARLPGSARGRAVAITAVLAVAFGATVAALPSRAAAPSLLTAGIAESPCHPGRVFALRPGVRGSYLPGSSVVAGPAGVYLAPGRVAARSAALSACVRADVRASGRWLRAGTVPGTSPRLRAMATRALLDLRLLVQPDGAVVAGWYPDWKYAWPRDSSWVAVALADTGHRAEALRILEFLARMQQPDGTWAARYWPDGSGPVRDGRPAELDADGWVPWAVWSVARAARAARSARAARVARVGPGPGTAVLGELHRLWPMVRAAADAAARSLTRRGLPAAAMDYWEDSVQVTLGTAAPLLAGLRAAAGIARELGAAGPAGAWRTKAARLSAAIRSGFGSHGDQRLPGAAARSRPGSGTGSGTGSAGGADAAVTFLGPPFGPRSPAVLRAARACERALTLPGGGVLPGTDWPGSTSTAWTAETGFFALLWAEVGDRRRSAGILSWLAAHRTGLGALPEQVSGGRPASVAPLDWTDAVVLLAMLAERRPLPAPAPPGGP